ncbi:alpha/beta hydrolase [Bacillus thuringiensis serovar brasilensis]|uniref:alpha/beta hydrolase n=1 Tax=Bacillus cereus group TaxID=86661 RepID=UPI000A3789F1|nr:alpha/beta hydrolase [Bacillus thuringiensis]MCU5031403.1 alpha/beta hydrolase [Bacillus cereus]MRA74142.1 alpha/beta hydrolase fold domain-containing protein [Bacillus thuringiensis]MRA92748.1 alpha/beta hydrolase fold domain-containing protein [Bacillus thuringiensis]MRC55306.1 alpha/beta hydrolase fold domain-containing protein [Bacillus thuringiensis]OTX38750.1 alpha/beta hydrolase [Bacillus thuringiensis serovar brasilensis]
MTLHPEIKKVLDSIPKLDYKQKIILEEQRKAFNKPTLPVEKRVPVYSIEERTIKVSDAEDIPIRIYTPKESNDYPLLMYFHGGAFISGDLESHDEIVRPISRESGYKAISVGYRLAPEYPFPTGLQDCYDAIKWAINHKAELKWDGKNLAVVGDSAGGNLATAVSLVARDKKEFTITKQVLYYPSLDLDVNKFRYVSLIENGKGYGLESDQLADYNSFYSSGNIDFNNPLVSPVKEQNLEKLPSTFIITAEYDPLRDEGELFAENLRKSGVHVETKRYEGAIHGFLGKFTHLNEYKDSYQRTGTFLNEEI